MVWLYIIFNHLEESTFEASNSSKNIAILLVLFLPFTFLSAFVPGPLIKQCISWILLLFYVGFYYWCYRLVWSYLAFVCSLIWLLICRSTVVWQFMLSNFRHSQSGIPSNACHFWCYKEIASILHDIAYYCYPTYAHLWYAWVFNRCKTLFLMDYLAHLCFHVEMFFVHSYGHEVAIIACV